jgi:Protein of unknown function (DUF1761)
MKWFAGLNVWALPLAAVASFVFGGIWYGVLSKQWMAAANLSEAQVRGTGGPPIAQMVITFIAQMFMAWMFAGVLLHVTKSGVPATMRSGMTTGVFLWAGFVMTTLVVNHQFQMQKRALTLIDGVHWLGVLLIQGAMLGLWGLAR